MLVALCVIALVEDPLRIPPGRPQPAAAVTNCVENALSVRVHRPQWLSWVCAQPLADSSPHFLPLPSPAAAAADTNTQQV